MADGHVYNRRAQDGLRALFLLVNALFWCSSLGLVCYLTYRIVKQPNVTEFLIGETAIMYLLLTNGAATFITGFLGYCTGIRLNGVFIQVYIAMTSLFLLLDVSLVGWTADDLFSGDADYRSSWLTSANETTEGIQLELECCGYDGPTDYSVTAYPNSSSTTSSSINLPYSCYNQQITVESIVYSAYLDGCKVLLEQVGNTLVTIMFALCTAILILEVLGIILGAIILSRLRKRAEEESIFLTDDANDASKHRYRMVKGINPLDNKDIVTS